MSNFPIRQRDCKRIIQEVRLNGWIGSNPFGTAHWNDSGVKNASTVGVGVLALQAAHPGAAFDTFNGPPVTANLTEPAPRFLHVGGRACIVVGQSGTGQQSFHDRVRWRRRDI